MKKLIFLKYLTIFLVAGLFILTSCNEPIYDFEGFDGQLSGKIVDANGNVISGDIKVTTFAVNATGEKDITSTVLRVKNDGTYANTTLHRQSYRVWLTGPFIGSPTDTIIVNLSGGQTVVKDYQVTPLLTIDTPVLNGNPSSAEIKVDYKITGNSGNTPNLREIYCSTVSWPTRTTGTGAAAGGFFTRTVTLAQNQGTATISGLQPKTRYFIRVGARASGQALFNHSLQIIVTTP